MTPDEIAAAKKRASTPTRSEWLALIAALEEAQGQVAALRGQAFAEAEQDISRLRAVTGYEPGYASGVDAALRAIAALREKARKP